MENLRNRFPTLITKMLENVDNESLVTFKETNRGMNGFIVEERFYWIRILRIYKDNFVEFCESWKMVIRKNPVKIVKEIAMAVLEFVRAQMPEGRTGTPRTTWQWAPLHIAAQHGNLRIFQYIFHKTNKAYPIKKATALHLAAQEGHLEICQYILNNISIDRNITDFTGRSPIHFAASSGHLLVCKLLIENLDLQNCKTAKLEITPLHQAARHGHLEVCKLLIENMKEKNPPSTHKGETPLHWAAKFGHLEVCKLLIGKLENKNPSNDLGWTPLHAAAKNGHGEICKLIASNIVNKNPVSNDGLTPHQLWLSFGSVFK